jgi:anti-anti-sigma factor
MNLPTAAGGKRSLFFTHTLKGGVLTIRPAGPSLGQREAAILNSEVRPILDKLGSRLRALVIDLSDVQAMASFGLGVCIEFRNTAHAFKAPTIVFGLSDELAAMFRLMKVDRLYTIVRSTQDLARALAA